MSTTKPPDMPSYCKVKWAVLQHFTDDRTYMFGEIESAMENHFERPEKLYRKSHRHSNDDDNPVRHGGKVFYKCCNNACKYLAELGLLERQGGFYEDREYKITPLGREVAVRKPCNIVKKYVEQVKRELENATRLKRMQSRGSREN